MVAEHSYMLGKSEKFSHIYLFSRTQYEWLRNFTEPSRQRRYFRYYHLCYVHTWRLGWGHRQSKFNTASIECELSFTRIPMSRLLFSISYLASSPPSNRIGEHPESVCWKPSGGVSNRSVDMSENWNSCPTLTSGTGSSSCSVCVAISTAVCLFSSILFKQLL